MVTIKQSKVLTKFEKWWLSKPMCIEGEKACLARLLHLHALYVHIYVYQEIFCCIMCTFIHVAGFLSQTLLTWTTILELP